MGNYSSIGQILEAEGKKFWDRVVHQREMFEKHAEPFTKTELVTLPGDEVPHELKTIDTYSMSPEQLDTLDMYRGFLERARAKMDIFEDILDSSLSEEEMAGLTKIPGEHPEKLYSDMLVLDPEGRGYISGQIRIADENIDSQPIMTYEEYSDFYASNLSSLLQRKFNLTPEQVNDAIHDYALQKMEPYIPQKGGMTK